MKRHDEYIPPEKRFKHPIGAAVHAILWKEWDPIGVHGVGDDWPDDEYDSYVWPVISKVMSGASVQDVLAYLRWVETDYMGLSSGGGPHTLRIAEKLVALRESGAAE